MQAATFTAVVVFPTPPFWFAIAYTMPMTRADASGGSGGSPLEQAIETKLVRSQRRFPAERGRFVAMPGRRGYSGGVGLTLRNTCSVRRSEPGNGTTGRTVWGNRPRCAAAADPSAASDALTVPFHATSTPPS